MTATGLCLLFGAAAVLLTAGTTKAQVLQIGDDGQVTTNTGPALYLSPDLRPQPLAPQTAGAPRPHPFAAGAPDHDVAAAIDAASNRFGLSPRLIEAVAWRESRFDPQALSAKGAIGVMQLMPATARTLGVDPFSTAANIHGGAAYLRWLLQRYDGDVVKSLAAYNAGPGAVDRFGGTPPYRETRNYVDAVLDRMTRMTLTAQPSPNIRPERVQRLARLRSAAVAARPSAPRLIAASMVALAAQPAYAQAAGDPPGSGPIVAALQWVQGTLMGSLATTAAVIAVAVVGLMMLTGRIEWRRGITVVLGAFIIFGAVAIVAGLRSVAAGAG